MLMLALNLDPRMREVLVWVNIVAGVVIMVIVVYRNFRNRR
jgi:hypothetical protein